MADFPTVLTRMLPERALSVAVRLSKELLRRHAARVKGDKALIDSVVASAWVTTMRHDTCGVAPYKSEQEGDFSELVVAGVRLHAKATPAQINRVQQLIHIAVPYPLLLAIETGKATYLSILAPGASVDSMVRAQVFSEISEFFCFINWQQETQPPHLLALFNHWSCAIHALALMQNKPALCTELPFVPLSSPQTAARLFTELHRLNQEWKATTLDLKKATNPQQRINHSKHRHQLGLQIHQLLQSHHILS